MDKKNIFIIGGLGTIGIILSEELNKERYNITLADIANECKCLKNYLKIDITNYKEILEKMPSNLDVIINLVGMPEQRNIVDEHTASKMIDIYVKGTYNLYYAAIQKGVKKIIFGSSNHVTDYFEENGFSKINRKINTQDYPLSKSLYGVLKLASENIGFAFSNNSEVEVINLRIGTVRSNESEAIKTNGRFSRTLLFKDDLVNIFECAISSEIKFGNYYAVSQNKDCPWDIQNALIEIGFNPLDKKN